MIAQGIYQQVYDYKVLEHQYKLQMLSELSVFNKRIMLAEMRKVWITNLKTLKKYSKKLVNRFDQNNLLSYLLSFQQIFPQYDGAQ